MVYYFCAVVDSDSTTTQFGFLVAKRLNIRHMQWNIAFVLLVSLTQQQHKLDFPSQITWNYAFMTNSIRFIIDFESTIAYIWFLTEQILNLDHIYWKITSVLLLSQSQRQHKLDFLLHDPYNTVVMVNQISVVFELSQQQHNSDFLWQST